MSLPCTHYLKNYHFLCSTHTITSAELKGRIIQSFFVGTFGISHFWCKCNLQQSSVAFQPLISTSRSHRTTQYKVQYNKHSNFHFHSSCLRSERIEFSYSDEYFVTKCFINRPTFLKLGIRRDPILLLSKHPQISGQESVNANFWAGNNTKGFQYQSSPQRCSSFTVALN
jgi:hypothetical protein